jgi:hypothetical protein
MKKILVTLTFLLALTAFGQEYMTNLLEVRNRVIKEFAESGKWKEVLK